MPELDHLQESQKLPVMVWIHGGAFLEGSGDTNIYGPEFFMKNGNVILVTINYRLGPLGNNIAFPLLIIEKAEFLSNNIDFSRIFESWYRKNSWKCRPTRSTVRPSVDSKKYFAISGQS